MAAAGAAAFLIPPPAPGASEADEQLRIELVGPGGMLAGGRIRFKEVAAQAQVRE